MNTRQRLQRLDSVLRTQTEFSGSYSSPQERYQDEVRNAERRLAATSYQGRGTMIGAGLGAGLGALAARKFFHGNTTGRQLRNRTIAGALLGSIVGGAQGRYQGEITERKKSK